METTLGASIDAGDTAWVLVCTCLVLLMTPGLALFYGGMVRAKHVLAMLMQGLLAIAVVSTTWVLVAYSLAFDDDLGGGLLGGFGMVGLRGAEDGVPGFDALPVPPLLFATFQMMFAVLTVALLSGAIADRVRLGSFVVLASAWTVVVYAPVAHWVFAPSGWLAQRGVLDFAGGLVVETASGASGLALAYAVGPRQGWRREPMPPHSLPLTVLGAGLLWFGWFGFNAGSGLRADGLAVSALLATHLAGVGGAMAWAGTEKLRTGHATTLGAASGAVAGLVAITPAAGFVEPLPALVLGLAAGGACVLAVQVKNRAGYDDALDLVGVHLVGGVIGTLAIGLIATSSVNAVVASEGLLYGGGLDQLGRQALGVLTVGVYAATVTYGLTTLISRTIGLRVTPDEEREGLDQALHAEAAYDLGVGRGLGRVG